MAFHWRITNSRLALFMFVTLSYLQLSSAIQSCSRKQNNFKNVSEIQYSSNIYPVSGTILVLYRMVHNFLDMVQPNPFPSDLVQELKQNAENLQSNYVKVLKYEIGFIVCAAIGILFFLFMPLVGVCFCCCRCCGNCGGKMYQEQKKSMNCRRRTLAAILVMVTTVILIGNICMFVSNENISESLQHSDNLLKDTLGNLKSYINSIPKQITTITNASAIPVASVSANLDNIGSSLGKTVLKKLGETIYPILNSASQLAQVVTEMNERLVLINSTAAKLLHQQEVLQQNVTIIQQNINRTLNMCGLQCVSIQGILKDLDLVANFGTTPNMDKEINAMRQIVDTNFYSIVQKGYKDFNDTPALLVNQSISTVSEIKKSLMNIEHEVQKGVQAFPLLTTLKSINASLDSVDLEISKYRPKIQEGNKYRWIVGIVLSGIIFLVVLCNYLGLLLGTACLKPNVNPIERSLLSNCGGNLLMAGVGFSFIFSWLLMLLVLIMFIAGGNVYSLVCKPWYDNEIFQVIESSGLMSNFNLAHILGLKDTHLSINNTYNDCHNNKSAWKALKLGQSFSLDEYLNLSKYTGDISSRFDQLNVNLSGITLLDQKGKTTLKDFLNTGIEDLNFTSISEQLQLPLFQQELHITVGKLQNTSKSLMDPVKTELNKEAASLNDLDSWIQTNMVPNIEVLKENIEHLQKNASHIEMIINTILLRIDSAQDMIHTKASDLVKNESKIFLDCQLEYFSYYMNWTKTMITENMAQCRPLADVLDSVAIIACSYLLDSLNAFWFCMGWSTIFLIPSIVFAVKLAKFYRRMTISDVYENFDCQMEMQPVY
ncbi:prominin-2 isoform X1 [Chiloscyllium plagiosum]|uniref:prominin-2 isoform X1 n=2 Tax=Chiloscyllium plagiosum TaxID=36176 RepID=UPI001CB87E90|nr:prominin-2 isoform X1 [Chiloscyllium plagiosum]XP_043568873.1 prominin-2 isoform X1 [Chiloscyllium plagiosum]XP_043568874.1 prominin-2 isoform X1 [Chiloscyllium plagiosum]XP_043568875.1 prominin-2 isoform X1 [Chiloscyllium plagiosum]